jgi:hypothetical protein
MAINGSKKIEIQIELDNKGAVKSVKQLEDALKEADQSVKKAEDSFSGMSSTIKGIVAGTGLALLTKEVISLAQEGARIEGLSNAFQDLQTSVGANGAENLNKLRTATSGLVSDLELMRVSNQAVLLGLPTEGFDKMAEAATKLGQATGRTTTEALNDLVTGVGRASKLILDNLGILVDTESAYQKYADSIGVATDKLTDQQKTLAFQAEAYDAIAAKSESLAGIQDNAGNAISRLSVEYENFRSEVAISLNNNEALAQAFSNLQSIFVELQPAIKSLAGAFSTSLAVAIETITMLLEPLNFALKATQVNAFDVQASFMVMKKVMGQLQFGSLDINKAVSETAKELQAMGHSLKEVSSQMNPTRILIKGTSDTLKPLSTNTDEAKKKADELAKAWEHLRDSLAKVTGTTGLEKYDKQIYDLVDSNAKGIISNEQLAKSLEEIARSAGFGVKELGIYENKVQDASRSVQQAQEDIARANEKLAEDQKQKLESIFSGVQGAIASNLSEAFEVFRSGGSFDAVLKETSAQIGAAIGSYFGPIGAAIGELMGEQIGEGLGKIGEDSKSTWEGIGQMFGPLQGALGNPVGKLLGKAFGGRQDAAANARDAFENYIRDVLDEKKLQLVIDGQLQKLDFHITGGRDAFDGGALFGAFDGMSADNISAFSGIGESMASLMGITQDLGSQFGAILADNVGNLNNLQILIEQLGFSAEQMQEQVKNAWLAGDSTASDALATLNKIQQVTAQGIPDGVGMLSQAFDNLEDSAGNGRLALDALGDISVEATEKGITSLGGAMQDLIASGEDPKKVQAFFDIIKNAGITTLEELKNITVEQGLQISSALENTPDFFAEKIEKLEDIKNKLRDIESKEVDIKFNFKSTVDQNTQNAINAGAFTSAGIPNIGSEGI